MNGQNDENDDAKATGGTVAGRAATIVDKKPEPASPGAAADEEAAEEKNQGVRS